MSTITTVDLKERSGIPLGEDEEPAYELGENTYKLLEAAGLFHEGSMDEATFQQLLDDSRRMVEDSADAVEGYSPDGLIPPHLKDNLTKEQLEDLAHTEALFQEAREMLQDGMDEWFEALQILEEYIDTRHYPLVERGCEALFVASQKMHKVARLGEKAEKALHALDLETETEPDDYPEYLEEDEPFDDEHANRLVTQPLDQTDYSTLGDGIA